MNLYGTYRNAVKVKLKKATIVANRFHYTRIVANSLDSFRLELLINATKIEKNYLKNLRLSLFKDIENVKPEKIFKLQEKLNHAFDLNLHLKYVYKFISLSLELKMMIYIHLEIG